jgi:protein-disulfide isomerase
VEEDSKTPTFNPLYSIPTAVLLGSLIIAASILMHGGIIKIGKFAATPPSAPTGAAPAAPQAQKSQAEVLASLKDQAKKLGLDQNKFNFCLDSGDKATVVSKDLQDGQAAGVNGTPAFFINGRLLSGAQPLAEFKKVIEEELNNSAPATVERVEVAIGDLPVKGQASAPVTIIEFSDYECPFCERFFTQTEVQLRKEYVDTGKVKFYYRDFPLTQIHPGAQKGAEAARCAGDQNKYWEYHDGLFQNQASIF